MSLKNVTRKLLWIDYELSFSLTFYDFCWSRHGSRRRYEKRSFMFLTVIKLYSAKYPELLNILTFFSRFFLGKINLINIIASIHPDGFEIAKLLRYYQRLFAFPLSWTMKNKFLFETTRVFCRNIVAQRVGLGLYIQFDGFIRILFYDENYPQVWFFDGFFSVPFVKMILKPVIFFVTFLHQQVIMVKMNLFFHLFWIFVQLPFFPIKLMST